MMFSLVTLFNDMKMLDFMGTKIYLNAISSEYR